MSQNDDDVPLSAWLSYDLTTVRQRANLMVNETVSIMMDSIEKKQTEPRHSVIESPLIIRKSARIT